MHVAAAGVELWVVEIFFVMRVVDGSDEAVEVREVLITPFLVI